MVPPRAPSFLPCPHLPLLASRRAEPASGSGIGVTARPAGIEPQRDAAVARAGCENGRPATRCEMPVWSRCFVMPPSQNG